MIGVSDGLSQCPGSFAMPIKVRIRARLRGVPGARTFSEMRLQALLGLKPVSF